MLILDFRTGKMTKLALNLGDVASVVGPGALFGIGGAGLGSIIDMLAGTNRRWTKILGLLGLAGGAGLGGLGRYLDKRRTPNIPETVKTRLLWLAKETEKSGDQLVQERYPNPEDKLNAEASYINQTPLDLFDELVGDTTRKGWVWSYHPSEDDVRRYQLARYFLAYDWKLPIIDYARGVALRAHVLALYHDKIKPELRERIENDFNMYVKSLKQQLVSSDPDWDKVNEQLAKITTTLTDNGHYDVAYLLYSPRRVYELR